MVRPESVTVTADPAGAATVTSVAFLGPISRVYVALADGSVVSAQLSSSVARAFAPGDPVTVGVEPGECSSQVALDGGDGSARVGVPRAPRIHVLQGKYEWRPAKCGYV